MRDLGLGQAKLAILKFDEMAENKPSFVSASVLETLSNEDFFQEYVQIELGHWCGLDLRKMAEDSRTKDDYDKSMDGHRRLFMVIGRHSVTPV